MTEYAIMCHPGHNRVYFQQSLGFAAAELAIVGGWEDIRQESVAGIPYVTFAANSPLGEMDLRRLARLSFLYALFERRGEALIPVPLPEIHYLDPALGSMLKYTGKTNELFTRLLINLALSAAGYREDGRISLLDPMAGKGTTLFEGAALGIDTYGIEIGDRVVGEAYHFFKKWLEKEKLKHTSSVTKASGPDRSFTARRYGFQYAKTKEEAKEKIWKILEIVACGGEHAAGLFKKSSMDIIVADLPYGVQHGNVTREQGAFTRNPAELLRACLPGWRAVLKKDGAMALSWNTLVFSRESMIAILEQQDFAVAAGAAYEAFSHRVDQSINRDLVVAKKA